MLSRRLLLLVLSEVSVGPLGGCSSSLLLKNPASCPLIGGFTILLNLRGVPKDSDSFPDGAGLLTDFLVSLRLSAFPYPPLGLHMPTIVHEGLGLAVCMDD
jgi:hypothetical protein